jgi:hypothetical protein
MTRSKPRHSSARAEAIDRAVISDADNPAAWDEPVYVPPSESPRPAWLQTGKHLELSAKFFVLSVLHRLGADANLTLAQPDNVDITVVRASGQALTIDVKTLTGTTSWRVDQFRARRHHFVVFVCFLDAVQDPEQQPRVVVIPSQQLERFVSKRKTTSVSIDDLSAHLRVPNPWSQLLSESAA